MRKERRDAELVVEGELTRDRELWVPELRKFCCQKFGDPTNTPGVQLRRLEALRAEAALELGALSRSECLALIPLHLVLEALGDPGRTPWGQLGVPGGSLGCPLGLMGPKTTLVCYAIPC